MLFGKQKIIEAQAKELEELKKQLSLAEEKNNSLEKELADLRSKELAIAKAMTDANLAAENILSQAREESEKTREKADKELEDAEALSNSIAESANETASKVIKEAEDKAANVISDAEAKGNDLLADAETKCQKRLQDTEDEVRSYASILVKLNENMKEQAKLAQEASERYAAFYEQMSKSIPGIMNSITSSQLPEANRSPKSDNCPDGSDSVIRVSDILTVESEKAEASTEDILNSIS